MVLDMLVTLDPHGLYPPDLDLLRAMDETEKGVSFFSSPKIVDRTKKKFRFSNLHFPPFDWRIVDIKNHILKCQKEPKDAHAQNTHHRHYDM